jgi:hypothetical protein
MLFEVMLQDGVGALCSYLKMNVQKELSLEHGVIFWIIPPDPRFNTPGIPFEEDSEFPDDPWKKE